MHFIWSKSVVFFRSLGAFWTNSDSANLVLLFLCPIRNFYILFFNFNAWFVFIFFLFYWQLRWLCWEVEQKVEVLVVFEQRQQNKYYITLSILLVTKVTSHWLHKSMTNCRRPSLFVIPGSVFAAFKAEFKTWKYFAGNFHSWYLIFLTSKLNRYCDFDKF